MASTKAEEQPDEDFDPEDFRMSLGDHLEELRSRLLKGIYGFVIAAIVCLAYGGERMMALFCKPLTDGLRSFNLPPQLITTGLTDAFSVYMNVSLIIAGAVAAPWLLYQLWQFVAAGLYPSERKTVTKYMPFSIALLISGMLFLYFVVLPITCRFLILFTVHVNAAKPSAETVRPTTQQVLVIPELKGDPEHPLESQLWYNSNEKRLKWFGNGEIRTMQFASDSLLSPMIDLRGYINLVLILLLLFGVSFQLPLVVLAVARIGIVDIATLKKGRRVVYFLTAVLAAVIVPDVVSGMLALWVPLIFLYELGIYLAARALRQIAEKEAAEEAAEREEARKQREKRAAAVKAREEAEARKRAEEGPSEPPSDDEPPATGDSAPPPQGPTPPPDEPSSGADDQTPADDAQTPPSGDTPSDSSQEAPPEDHGPADESQTPPAGDEAPPPEPDTPHDRGSDTPAGDGNDTTPGSSGH